MQIQKMLKQAQKLQQDMAKLQEELAQKTVEGSAGGGAVRVTVNGESRITAVKIDPSVMQAPVDAGMLEDMVLTAANQALEAIKKMTNEQMGKLTGGMGLPGF